MPSPQVNGEVSPASKSATIQVRLLPRTPEGSGLTLCVTQHLSGYPVVKSGIETFKANPYGQKSLQLGDSAFKTFAAPVLPYLAGPYQYVSPYVKRADDLGEKTLTRIDERVPAVKKPTDELFQDAKNLIYLPYRYGLAGRDHVLDTYSSEKAKVGKDTYINSGWALVNTAVTVAGEAIEGVTTAIGYRSREARSAVANGLNGDEKPIR